MKTWRGVVAAILVAVAGCGLTAQAVPEPLGRVLLREHAQDSLVIDPRPIMRTATWLWDNANEREWMGCLHGELVGDTVRFTGIEMADMLKSDSISAVGRCRTSSTMIGRIHAHDNPTPVGWTRCGQSQTDWENFHFREDWAYDVILCDREGLWISIEKMPTSRIVIDSIG